MPCRYFCYRNKYIEIQYVVKRMQLMYLLWQNYNKYIANITCDRNTFRILNCHLCGASKLGQVTMIEYMYTIMTWTGVHCIFAVKTFF